MDSDVSPIPTSPPAPLGPSRVGRDARPGARQRRQFERDLRDDNKNPEGSESEREQARTRSAPDRQHPDRKTPNRVAQDRPADDRSNPKDEGSTRHIDILA